MSDTPIRRESLKAAGRALRFQVLSILNQAFARSGISIETVACRLSCSPRHVRRALAGKTQLEMREIAALAWAIDGSLVVAKVTPRAGEEE